ncbi:MAG: hypothetical protein J7K46_12725 [Bacteroidales bacterium]|nr:hypothetical protein [Bacteroidales bacterium]
MKRLIYVSLVIATAAVFSSCSGLNKMKKEAGNISYQVTPKVLEEHAGQVKVAITGQFPEKYFNKKATVTAIPVLIYNGGEKAYAPVTLQGESVEANNKTISYSGGKFSYNGVVDFSDSMRISHLVLRATASLKTKSVDFEPVPLADGVIATPTLVKKMPRPTYIPDHYQRVVPKTGEADINFVINRYNIRRSELKAEDIKSLFGFIQQLPATPNLKYTGSEIHGYASPDGPYKFNDKLSKKRAATVDKFMKKTLKSGKVLPKGDAKFTEHSTAEDWEGFKKLVAASNMKDKDLILRVLSMYSDPDVREKEIKNMAEAYDQLKKDILPELRRSVIRVNADLIGLSDDEILNYIETKPDTVSLEAMLHAAGLVKDLDKKLKYYQMAFDKEPRCIRAINNVGAVYLQKGDIANAEKAFKQAQALKDMDPVKSNLGFVELMKGNLDKASEYFTSMQKPTKESNFGLGTIAIINGKYQDAVNYFGTEPSFNAALAKLLNGDVQGAKSTLDAIDHTCKWKEYLKAVVNARLGDDNGVFESLKKAVGMDPKLKEEAKTDMEFAKYFENEQFKAIVQ